MQHRALGWFFPFQKKSDLGKLLHGHFKNELLVENDVVMAIEQYPSLKPSLSKLFIYGVRAFVEYNGTEVVLNLRGTLPFTFCKTTYNCPLLITLGMFYPMAPPILRVLTNDSIKLTKNHPHVAANGLVKIPYLESWTTEFTLREAIRLTQLAFNIKSPIYSITPSSQPHAITVKPIEPVVSKLVLRPITKDVATTTPSITTPTPVLQRDSSYGDISGKLEDAKRMISSMLINDRSKLLTEYQYNIANYELHKLILENWVPMCSELGVALKAQNADKERLDRLLNECHGQLHTLEAIDDYYSRVVAAFTEFKRITSMPPDQDDCATDTLVAFSVSYSTPEDERLCRAIASEAAADAMLELIQSSFKRKLVTTKQYIQYIRQVSNEKFRAMHDRLLISRR
ncbi:hypothetical protein BaOVIS_016440 [Babesia ovis]|uniref:UEV domain-containing protein n=1 Tax=Babesia ovis TaxID=5869 RepID=A0A9W5WUQ9_BABOV|nr:hypothetical protein BaOVIS_016440 [Babesia ovis]